MKIPIFKINLFGQEGVGKTTLALKIKQKEFEIIMTLGANIIRKKLKIHDNEIILSIWDKAGSEKFDAYNHLFSRSNGGIFIYDITQKLSLENIDMWIKRFRKASKGRNQNIPILMLGNKVDLKNNREISRERALALKKEFNLFTFFEISAKTGKNVEEAIISLANPLISDI